jgi:hypothetical protein
MKEYIEGDYLVTELDSGAVIKIIKPQEEVAQQLPTQRKTINQRLDDIELLLLAQGGIIQ